jgi:hypothetical protein
VPFLQLSALCATIGDHELVNDYEGSAEVLEAVALSSDPTRTDHDFRRYAAWYCSLPSIESISHARHYLQGRPTWSEWQKRLAEACSRGGGEESIGWQYPDEQKALEVRNQIFQETLSASHRYVAVEIVRQWPQASLLGATEDLFILAAPELPSENALAFSRLPSLQFQVQKGAAQ